MKEKVIVIFELCWTIIMCGKSGYFSACATAIFTYVNKVIIMQFKFFQGSVATVCR